MIKGNLKYIIVIIALVLGIALGNLNIEPNNLTSDLEQFEVDITNPNNNLETSSERIDTVEISPFLKLAKVTEKFFVGFIGAIYHFVKKIFEVLFGI